MKKTEVPAPVPPCGCYYGQCRDRNLPNCRDVLIEKRKARENNSPVPPADGYVSLIEAFTRLQRRLISYCNRANAGHMPSDAREFARRVLLGFQSAYEEAGVTPPAIEPETAAEYAALAPLPAGAAEAVALANEINTALTSYLDAIGRGPGGEVEKLLLQQILWDNKAGIIAFLRLASPPLRGEREASELIELFAKIAERYDGWQAEMIAAQIRSEGKALSDTSGDGGGR